MGTELVELIGTLLALAILGGLVSVLIQILMRDGFRLTERATEKRKNIEDPSRITVVRH